MRYVEINLALIFFASSALASDLYRETIPNKSYQFLIKERGEIPECHSRDKNGSFAINVKESCVCKSKDSQIMRLILKADENEKEATSQIVYKNDAFLYKTLELTLRSSSREAGLAEFNLKVEGISEEIRSRPRIGRFSAFDAIDQSRRYDDIIQFLNNFHKDLRWEDAKSAIPSLSWNEVVAVWKTKDGVVVEAKFTNDELLGSRILVVAEDTDHCDITDNSSCLIEKAVREIAANPSLKADGPDVPPP